MKKKIKIFKLQSLLSVGENIGTWRGKISSAPVRLAREQRCYRCSGDSCICLQRCYRCCGNSCICLYKERCRRFHETEVTAVSVYLGRCRRCYGDRSYSCICLFGKMLQMLQRQKLQLYLSIWENVADVMETEVTDVSE